MSIEHLTDDELDLALVGEELPAPAAAHLSSCLVCRRRRDSFLAAVDGALGEDPDEATRTRIREQALSAWSGGSRKSHLVQWRQSWYSAFFRSWAAISCRVRKSTPMPSSPRWTMSCRGTL